MNTSIRLDNALLKLYEAFHNDTLVPECCKQCAVGNILNQSDSWKHFSDEHGSIKLNYVGMVNQKFGKRFAGYTPLELLNIEMVFLKACGFQLPLRANQKTLKLDKDIMFRALEETVAYLCRLDGKQQVMDCTALFNYSPNRQKLASRTVSLV